MKKWLIGCLVLVLCLTGGIGFSQGSRSFVREWREITDENKDSFETFNGVVSRYRVSAQGADNENEDYSCAALVKRYYAAMYNVWVMNLYGYATPDVYNINEDRNGYGRNYLGEMSEVKVNIDDNILPQEGDIARMPEGTDVHWAIVKYVVGGAEVVLFEQNYKDNNRGAVGRMVPLSHCTFFRWNGVDSDGHIASRNALDAHILEAYASPERIKSGDSASIHVTTQGRVDRIELLDESGQMVDAKTMPTADDGWSQKWDLSTWRVSGDYGRIFTVVAYGFRHKVSKDVHFFFEGQSYYNSELPPPREGDYACYTIGITTSTGIYPRLGIWVDFANNQPKPISNTVVVFYKNKRFEPLAPSYDPDSWWLKYEAWDKEGRMIIDLDRPVDITQDGWFYYAIDVEWAVFESSGSDWGKNEWDIDENWKVYHAQ